ncbi:MAG: hypothetical protein KKF65_04510 [Nanoarchaeota archaeon]|nr:hypothetical protein [Nanoarchaeota archaeon]
MILIPLFFSIYFRSYSYNLPTTDDWAYSNIYNSVKSQVSTQINQQYPNLPTADKNKLIEKRVVDFLDENSASLKTQIEQTSQSLKSFFQDESGQTYLLAIDPYMYWRYSQNVLDSGGVGDKVVNGKPFDDHMVAPLGKSTTSSLHPYFEAYFHKFMSIFTNNSLMKNIFFVPILLSALSVIPAFFIAKKRIGYFGGFVAAMIIAVHAAFIGRTAGGFADTDAYNVLFPLFIAWLFIEGFESKNWKKQLSVLLLSGFLVGVYSFAWSGWWYIFDLLIAVVLVYAAYTVLKFVVKNISFKQVWSFELMNSLRVFFIFFIASALFVSIFSGSSAFESAVKGPISFKVIKQAAHANLWPNVYTTVAELNPASISSIVSQIGGKLLLFIAGLGVVLTMIKRDDLKLKDFALVGMGAIVYLLLVSDYFIKLSPVKYLIVFMLPLIIGLFLLLKDERKIDIKYAIFLTIWFVGTIYASTKGTRFVLLMVPAFAIAFGIALGSLQDILSNLVYKEFKFNKKIISGFLIVLLTLLLVSPIKAAHQTAKGEVPSMSDAWWDTLTKIKNNSSENAIITSWWDFGHWFKAIADRPVTFDGGTQNRPQAHWVGKLLMSDDEDLSVSILRMLDCGGNSVFDEIDKKFQDTEKSVDTVYKLIVKDRESAENYLLNLGFSSEETNTILSYSHCEPPEAYLITSGDMVGKAGVWSHFGGWNFDRSYIYNVVRKENYQEAVNILMSRFNYTEDVANNYYYEVQALSSDEEINSWIAPWPNYGTNLKSCKNNSEVVECSIGLYIGKSNLGQDVRITGAVINLSNPSDTNFVLDFVDTTTGLVAGKQEIKPMNLVMAEGDSFEKYSTGGTDLVLDLTYDTKSNKALVSHPELSASLFTRLFYFDGRGTSHFEKFSDLTTVTGIRIIVWKVVWNPENE